MRMPWSKKEDNPLATQIHGGFATSILQKPREPEKEEELREDYLITNRSIVRKPWELIVMRDAGLNADGTRMPDAPSFLNGNAMAAEALGGDLWAFARLEKLDLNMVMRQVRIKFWEIAESLSEEDIDNGFLNALDVEHISTDLSILNSYKGWMTNRIKEHVDTHEVVMSRREAPKRIPGLGGNE